MAYDRAQERLLGGRYRLDQVVGRGGMGTVWRAYDRTLDRDVAIKEVELPAGLTESELHILYERTFREARASARLNHPGVVTVHDVLQEQGRPWIVMELVRARSLQDLLDDEGSLPHRRVAQIGLQMLAALRAAHEKGILHRDIKPSNVLITDAGRVVLTDFGIAQMEGDSTLTQTGLVMGSPAYIPPERAAGHRAVPASDLWSFGATLYASVEGRSPYERADGQSSLQAALTERVPPARNAGPLAEVLAGLLAREPQYRMGAQRAFELLSEVASAPEPSATFLDETVVDETMTDEPVTRFDASSTLLDEGEVVTLSDEPMSGRSPVPRSGTLPAPYPSMPPPQSSRQSQGPPPAQPHRHPQQDYRHQRSAAPSPSAWTVQHGRVDSGAGAPTPEPEAHAPPENDPSGWHPAPAWQQQPRPTPPPTHNPVTPQPWQSPSASQQHPVVGGAPVDRRRTVAVVSVMVVIFVVAVLAGAVIIRSKLTGG